MRGDFETKLLEYFDESIVRVEFFIVEFRMMEYLEFRSQSQQGQVYA